MKKVALFYVKTTTEPETNLHFLNFRWKIGKTLIYKVWQQFLDRCVFLHFSSENKKAFHIKTLKSYA